MKKHYQEKHGNMQYQMVLRTEADIYLDGVMASFSTIQNLQRKIKIQIHLTIYLLKMGY